MRNSATVTSRNSPISRCSSAPNARASSVAARGRSFARLTSSAAPPSSTLSIGSSRAPRKSGSRRRLAAPIAWTRPREAHRTTHAAAPRAPWPGAPAGTHRCLARAVSRMVAALLTRRARGGNWRSARPALCQQRRQALTERPRVTAAVVRGACSRIHRARRGCGMAADSARVSRCRRSLGSCFHSQRRPPGMRISTSTGPA